jgi:hypothetical protein
VERVAGAAGAATAVCCVWRSLRKALYCVHRGQAAVVASVAAAATATASVAVVVVVVVVGGATSEV